MKPNPLPSRAATLLRSTVAALAAAISFTLPAAAQLPIATPTPTPDPILQSGPADDAPLYAPGELLVSVRQGGAQGASASTGQAMAAAVGAQVAQSIDTTGPNDDRTTYRLTVPAGQEYQVAEQLARDPNVAWVSPNWRVWAAQEGDVPVQPAAGEAAESADAIMVTPGFAVNDPFYAERQWNMQRVNAARAWQMAFGSGLAPTDSEVVVAVIDSGIDTTHPDFAGRLLPGGNYVEEDRDGDGIPDQDPTDVTDLCGHGTHIAGIVAAGLNDDIGVAGMAPNVKIDARRTLYPTGGGCGGFADAVASAIVSATADGADIINMSLVLSQDVPIIREAVEFAQAQGVLLVAAAGNAGIGVVYYPAAYPDVVGVAALAIDDRRTYYSNFGPEIAIAASGGTADTPVFSAWSSQAFYTTTVGGGVQTIYRCANRYVLGTGEYCTQYGTSQATPAVAGVAALLLSIDPNLTAAQLRSILTSTASPLEEGAEFVGAGKLDALTAVRTQLPTTLTVTPSSLVTTVLNSAVPFTLSVRIDNRSLAALPWRATLEPSLVATAGGSITPTTWITLSSGISNTQTGAARYGEPGFITLAISPTATMTGTYEAAVAISATTSGGVVQERVGLLATVIDTPDEPVDPPDPEPPAVYLPMVMGSRNRTANVPFAWVSPAGDDVRVTLPLTDTSVVTVTALPAGLTVRGEPIEQLRVYSDGFVVAVDASNPPDDTLFDPSAPRCTPTTPYPDLAAFGWWADLDPGAAGARVSVFALGSERYVVEYLNVPAAHAEQPYRVSFQIVLHRSGAVRLNYLTAPTFAGAPAPHAVGVESAAARFYSLVSCASDTQIVGELPRSQQSIFIRAADIF